MIDNQISRLIKNEIQLPTLPAVAAEILKAVNQDEAALSKLGKIISLDPALSAKMLRVANSGLFTCNREITDLNRAMSILGTNTIKSIALSFVLSSELASVKERAFNLDDFWRRAVTSAVSAELLANLLKRSNKEIFLLGLLQDIGILVSLMSKTVGYRELLESELDSPENLISLEREQYGFDHQQVACLLFKFWNLPSSLSEPILYHHHPEDAADEFRQTAEILNLADQLAEIYSGDKKAERARLLQETLLEKYSLGTDEVIALLDNVAEKSCEMIALFDIEPEEMQPYSQLLQQANSELEKLNLSNSQVILELQEAKEQNQRLVLKLQDANKRLKELVYHDGLTGVHNHRYFQEALDSELARANRYRSSVSLILFDLDNFKEINDTYGHPIGDLVLKNIACSVNSSVRANDVVSRFGGDEFAIILPATNSAGAKAFAEHLRSSVEGIATMVKGKWVTTTISVGAATAEPGDKPISKDVLIEAADRGLYQSKQSGRNQVQVAVLAAS